MNRRLLFGLGGAKLVLHVLLADRYGYFRDELYFLDCLGAAGVGSAETRFVLEKGGIPLVKSGRGGTPHHRCSARANSARRRIGSLQ